MPAATTRLFGPRRPEIVGHRGAPVSAPENTPASFAAAHAGGARWVELDARLTADGGVVVNHDPTLRDGRVIVELSVGEVELAGGASLAAVLAGLPTGLGVDLEIKNAPGELDHQDAMAVVAACIDAVGSAGERPLLVTSFDPVVLLAAAERGWDVPLGLLSKDVPMSRAIAEAADLGCVVVCPHHATEGLDVAGIAAAHAAGLQVMAWTVDDLTRQFALMDAGIDAICTNDPVAAVRNLDC